MAVAEEEAPYYDEEEGETQLLNAEEVTLIATRFLRRLGNKHGLKPFKASPQGERYIVEVELKKKIVMGRSMQPVYACNDECARAKDLNVTLAMRSVLTNCRRRSKHGQAK